VPTTATLNTLAANWSTLMVAVVWQSTVLAIAVAVVAWLLRRAAPAVRYWLWQIVAIKILLAPLWTFAVPLVWLPQRPAPQGASRTLVPDATFVSSSDSTTPIDSTKAVRADETPVAIAPHPIYASTAPRPGPDLSWQAWLMLIWAGMVGVQIVMLAVQRARLARLLSEAGVGGPAIESLVAECAAKLRMSRVPRVVVTGVECSPFVCGLWRPTIVLPRSLEAALTLEQIAPVVVHELAHVRRLDLVFGWIPQLTRMVYFFHPIAYWVAFRVRLEGELACDGWAMAETGHGAGAYADLLVRVVSRLSEPAMLRTGSAASAGLDGQQSLKDK
jgi:beta-lactamase regulating signal transducer with metallopeptidase domain